MIARLPVEHGFAFTPSGKLIFHQTSGSPHQILLQSEQQALLADAVFTHNHPDARSISVRDVELAMYFGLRQVRAVTTWARYWIDVPKRSWTLHRRVVLPAIESERPLVVRALQSDIEAGTLSAEDADRMYEHMLWRRLADRGVLRYGYDFWHMGAS